MALAGEYKARLYLIRFEGVVPVHIYLACFQFSATGTAHAPFAGEGQVNALFQCGLEDGIAIVGKGKATDDPVQLDGYQGMFRIFR